ncbi:hypothetical protein Lfu02_12750 [Longispora fulva]|nr:hypothetical protein Lfu02_12750 [Longispora fulva]
MSPVKALIRLLAELVLELHRPVDGVDVCVGCAMASGTGQTFPCWPANAARDALEVVDGG